jgi:hypothetical protein
MVANHLPSPLMHQKERLSIFCPKLADFELEEEQKLDENCMNIKT